MTHGDTRSGRRTIIGGLAVVSASLALLGLPFRFSVVGVQTSVLECIAFMVFAGVVLLGRAIPISRSYMFVIATAMVPLFVGIYLNPITHVARDYVQIVYVAFIWIGYYLGQTTDKTRDKVLSIWCVITALYCSLFVLARYFEILTVIIDIQYNWRIPVGLVSIVLFARILGLPIVRSLTAPVSCLLIIPIVAYSVDIRTRAFLLLVLVGGVVVLFGAIGGRNSGTTRWRVGVVALAGGYLGIVAALALSATGLVLGGLADDSSVSRILGLQSGLQGDVTAQFRLDAWRAAIDGSAVQWFVGHGFGSYLTLDPWIRGTPELLPSALIHNTPLQILYLGGVVHLSSFIYISYMLWSGYDDESSVSYSTAIVRRGFIAGFIVYSLFSVTLFDVSNSVIVWILIGFLAYRPRVGRALRDGHPPNTRLHRRTPPAIRRGDTRPRPLVLT